MPDDDVVLRPTVATHDVDLVEDDDDWRTWHRDGSGDWESVYTFSSDELAESLAQQETLPTVIGIAPTDRVVLLAYNWHVISARLPSSAFVPGRWRDVRHVLDARIRVDRRFELPGAHAGLLPLRPTPTRRRHHGRTRAPTRSAPRLLRSRGT